MANLYQIGKVKIDSVTSEEGFYSSEITERKVEDGSPITDHVSPNTLKLNLECTIVGDDAKARKATLARYRKQGDTVNYRGRELYPKMLIKSINSVASAENINGFDLTIQLEQWRATKYQSIKSNANAGKVKPRPKPGSGGGGGGGSGGGGYRPNPPTSRKPSSSSSIGKGGITYTTNSKNNKTTVKKKKQSSSSNKNKSKDTKTKKTTVGSWVRNKVSSSIKTTSTSWAGIGVDGLPMKTPKKKPRPVYDRYVTGTGGTVSVR